MNGSLFLPLGSRDEPWVFRLDGKWFALAVAMNAPIQIVSIEK